MRRILLSLLAIDLLLISPGQAFVVGSSAHSQPITIGVNEAFELPLMRSANLGWTRVTFVWRDINPAFGVYNWGVTDSIVNNARAQGLKILAILSTAPTWAGSNSNGTTPPANIGYWEEFVHQVAQRYAGRVDAYEIWNEPNLFDSGTGIGWNADIWASPRYVDYLRAAAINIRTYAPGTLVVGPVTSSRPDSRTVEVFKQLEQVSFPDGPASKFLDVVSFHANASDDESTATIVSRIESQLSTLSNRNPSNAAKPIWLTEFGWKSNRVGEASQRDRIRNIVTTVNGQSCVSFCDICAPSSTHCAYKWTHVFIYKGIDSATESSGIFRGDKSAKPVVTDYLRTFAFPAKQPNDEYAPFTFNCTGRTCTFSSSIFDNSLWDFGDGTTGQGQVVTHTFPASGQYFVAVGSESLAGSDVQLIRVF
jgi:hypothetical protein